MSPTAFVAGATGFTGREVVRLLVEAGARCVAHVRPDSSRLDHWRERFTELGAEPDATPWEAGAMRDTLTALAPTHVYALLGTTRKRARRAKKRGDDPAEQSYEAVDYGLTALLLEAAVASGAAPRFIYLSSAGVREGTRNSYLQARVRVEAELRESGLSHVIARPSFITGDRDEQRTGEAVGATVADALLSVAGVLGGKRLKERYRSTDNTTLASALVRLGLDPEAEGVYESEALREP